MLILTQAPNQFTPSTLGRPVAWRVYNDSLVTQPARASRYVITMEQNGHAAGLTFRLRGQDFQTGDDSARYTDSTFYSSPSASIYPTLTNLIGMLRLAPAFRGYAVRSNKNERQEGESYKIIAEAGEAATDEASAADNDLSALAGISLVYEPGQPEQRADERLYYRVYNASTQVGPERYAPFDQNAEALIDVRTELRGLVSFSDPPDLARLALAWDDQATARLTVRYGTYQTGPDSLQPVYGPVHEADAVPVVAALFQPWEVRGMEPYGPNRAPYNQYGNPTALLPWLTVRNDRRRVARQSHEWTSIYLGIDPIFGGPGRRRLVTTYYAEDEVTELPYTWYQEFNRGGVMVVPSGGQAIPPFFTEYGIVVGRITMQVQVDQGSAQYRNESTVLDLRYYDQDCRAGELYLLEGRGSWATIGLKEVLNRRLVTMGGSRLTFPLTYNANQGPTDPARPFYGGGLQRTITAGAETFRVRTARVRSKLGRLLESVAASPYGILRWADPASGEQRLVKVLFEPEQLITHLNDGPEPLELQLTSTAEMFVR